MPDMMGGMAGWMMALIFLVPLLFLVLLAVVIAWMVRAGRVAPEGPEAPLTILQRRYARGDVGSEEYERIRTTLTKD